MLPLLEGVRILSVEQYGAGPFGTQFLADLGAEVIKIENPTDGGDMARGVGPHFLPDMPDTARSVFFQGLNRGKRSVTLDLGRAEGRAAFARLAAKADAVATNLRGDVPAALGLDHAALAAVNPRIVCAHLSGYGRDGERARWPGYDYLMQAEAGIFHLTGDPAGAPSRMGLSVIDLMTGVVLGLALVSGVMRARGTGQGMDVDVSLFDLALFDLNYIAHWYLNAGAVTTRLPRSAHPSLVPCQAYRTRDGWIYLMCNKEKFWRALCECVSRDDWIDDPRFVDFAARLRHRELLTRLIDEVLAPRTTAEWMERFAGRVPAAPILDLAQAMRNPFFAERGLVREARCDADDGAGPDPGTCFSLLANPIRTAGAPALDRAAPGLGQHTRELLSALGYAGDTIDALIADGIIR
jgi:crotonobetainyl-CoA:carnitine CoA-transferase CaiB-like acyl-CoA transferase